MSKQNKADATETILEILKTPGSLTSVPDSLLDDLEAAIVAEMWDRVRDADEDGEYEAFIG